MLAKEVCIHMSARLATIKHPELAFSTPTLTLMISLSSLLMDLIHWSKYR